MALSCSGMNLEFIKPQNLGSLLMKSSQSNFNLQSPGSHLVRSYLITTVQKEYRCKILIYLFFLSDFELLSTNVSPKYYHLLLDTLLYVQQTT